ncbi:MAG: iron ABC transporter permease [Aggregatilineales bacterium]
MTQTTLQNRPIKTKSVSHRAESAVPRTSARVTAQPRLRLTRLALLTLIFLAAFAVNLALGSVNIPLKDVIVTLLGGEPERATWARIILMIRLPTALTATLAGAALAVSGLMMQTFFRNPLAGPFVIGISSGASLGVALVVLTGGATLLATAGLGGTIGVALAASVGAGVVMVLVLIVARRVESSMTLLIIGVMIGFATSAVVSILMYFSRPEQITTYIRWGFGSFGGVSWQTMPVFSAVIAMGLLLALGTGKSLNALLLGETYATSMGLNVTRARLAIIVSSALLAGAVTAFCGPIGFIGLAVPHLCRGLFNTSDHRVLLPACVLMGGLVALIADIVAAMPGNMEFSLPLNAITALLGAPVVIWVILRGNSMGRSFG